MKKTRITKLCLSGVLVGSLVAFIGVWLSFGAATVQGTRIRSERAATGWIFDMRALGRSDFISNLLGIGVWVLLILSAFAIIYISLYLLSKKVQTLKALRENKLLKNGIIFLPAFMVVASIFFMIGGANPYSGDFAYRNELWGVGPGPIISLLGSLLATGSGIGATLAAGK